MSRALIRSRVPLIALGVVTLGLTLFSVPATAATNVANIRYGSRGDGVHCVQDAINNFNHNYNLISDGIFGSQTYYAVRRFQSANGLQVDGIVGRRTGEVILNSDYNISYAMGNYCYYLVPTSY